MELRMIAEHMKEAASRLEGGAWIGAGLGLALSMRWGKDFWNKKKWMLLLGMGLSLGMWKTDWVGAAVVRETFWEEMAEKTEDEGKTNGKENFRWVKESGERANSEKEEKLEEEEHTDKGGYSERKHKPGENSTGEEKAEKGENSVRKNEPEGGESPAGEEKAEKEKDDSTGDENIQERGKIVIVQKDIPDCEYEGKWYYQRPMVIQVRLVYEEGEEETYPETAEEMPFYLSVYKNEEGWKEITLEEWSTYGISMERLPEEGRNTWELMFAEEIIGRIGSDQTETDQEIVLDTTAPTVSKAWIVDEKIALEQEMTQKTDASEGVISFFSGSVLTAGISVEDTVGIRDVSCTGWNREKAQVFYREDPKSINGKYQMELPEDFCGFLRWKVVDFAGNEMVWEGAEGICLESKRAHEENGGVAIESLESPEEFCRGEVTMRLRGWDSCSGIWCFRVWKNDTLILEDVLENGSGSIKNWEKLLTVPAEGARKVTIRAEMEDMAGHRSVAERVWFNDEIGPRISLAWEGNQKNGFFTGKGVLRLTVREENFQPELIKFLWEKHPRAGSGPVWEQTGMETYECGISFEQDGEYQLRVEGCDLLGNKLRMPEDNPSSVIRWKEDSQKPVIFLKGIQDEAEYNEDVSMEIEVTDPWLDVKHSTIYLVGERLGVITVPVEKKDGGIRFVWNPGVDSQWDDRYQIYVEAADLAGNVEKRQVEFVVNRTGSVYKVTGLADMVSSGLPDIIIEEENLSQVIKHTILCIWEGEAVILKEGVDYKVERLGRISKYILRPSLFSREGLYTITIISEDSAGNRRSNLKNKKVSIPISFSVNRVLAGTISDQETNEKEHTGEHMQVQVRVLKPRAEILTVEEDMEESANRAAEWENSTVQKERSRKYQVSMNKAETGTGEKVTNPSSDMMSDEEKEYYPEGFASAAAAIAVWLRKKIGKRFA